MSNEVPVGLAKSEHVRTPNLTTLLIFGLGPVIDINSREQAAQAGISAGNEDINLWSKTAALAASELIKRGQAKEAIIMGGRTGGFEFQSEAELISGSMQKLGISEELIKREDSSTNTITNIVNFLNMYVDVTNAPNRSFGIVAANYHLPRVKLLMDLFGVPYEAAFSNEEVIRFMAREGEGWNQQTLNELEQRLDMNAASRTAWSGKDLELNPGYYGKQLGTEQKSIHRRGQEEDVFTRALLEMPEYWIVYVGLLNNESRIRGILEKQDTQVLKDRFGVDLSEDISSIKANLIAIPRIIPSLDEWIPQQWPPETTKKLEDAIKERK